MSSGGYKPKLIEVALPLAAINAEAAREKSIRHGHPSTLHLWWARRPLAAARAVIWASLVDDPSGDESLAPEEQEDERQRLFGILERLVKWENSNNPEVLAEARAEIDRCFPEGPPPILDPFAGGGAIPLEAQRLGLKALAGDLNPVAVLINKAMIEIPPRFAGMPPVHPDIDKTLTTWERAQGLAADVEAYGRWMRDEAERRIGHLYPDATGPDNEKLTPIAWIWARTVESPDPSWSGHVPLVASWTLAKRPGKPKVWVEPIVDRDMQTIRYEVREGGEPKYGRTCTGGNGVCLATNSAIPTAYIKAESCAGRMGHELIAVVAEGKDRRVYCRPTPSDISVAISANPTWKPQVALPAGGLGFRVQAYGLDEWWKLFAPRQLVALATFTDLLSEVADQVTSDAKAADMAAGKVPLRDGGRGSDAYAEAVVTYLACVIDKCANLWSSLVTWMNDRGALREVFARQAIPMAWDYAEANPFSGRGGSWELCLSKVQKVISELPALDLHTRSSEAVQRDARAYVHLHPSTVITTDPPYYDNVGYADLSDFFYVWMRKSLSRVWPNECSTLLTPKAEEIIADSGRHGGPGGAREHFESGMAEFMKALTSSVVDDVPATIFYAYKATESKDGEIRSTGWDTILQAVLDAGITSQCNLADAD